MNSERIQWLERAYAKIRSTLVQEAPETCLLTIGFPYSRAGGDKGAKAIGQCWHGWTKGEGSFVTIHPCLFPDAIKILSTMAHEVIHTALPPEAGHRKPFAKIASRIGLVGKMTETVPSPELLAKLGVIATELGPLPDGEGDVQHIAKKQTTRQRKWTCPGECKQIIRAATDELNVICGKCKRPFEKEIRDGEDEETGAETDRHKVRSWKAGAVPAGGKLYHAPSDRPEHPSERLASEDSDLIFESEAILEEC